MCPGVFILLLVIVIMCIAECELAVVVQLNGAVLVFAAILSLPFL